MVFLIILLTQKKYKEVCMPSVQQYNVNVNDVKSNFNNSYRKTIVTGRRNDELNKASFLKLLIKQLEHQDPLNPVNDREFISQMAQFSALEQMHNVASSINSLKGFQANLLIGKTITGKDFITGENITGTVKQVFFDSSKQAFLKVNNRNIKLQDIISVSGSKQNNKPEIVSRETK